MDHPDAPLAVAAEGNTEPIMDHPDAPVAVAAEGHAEPVMDDPDAPIAVAAVGHAEPVTRNSDAVSETSEELRELVADATDWLLEQEEPCARRTWDILMDR